MCRWIALPNDPGQTVSRRVLHLGGLEGLAILRSWWLAPEATEGRAMEIADVVSTIDDDEFLSRVP